MGAVRDQTVIFTAVAFPTTRARSSLWPCRRGAPTATRNSDVDLVMLIEGEEEAGTGVSLPPGSTRWVRYRGDGVIAHMLISPG